ncbi:MAG: hypothetical protein AB3N06_00765 [Erythrobacter sp.]
MILRGSSGWQTVTADLALILFLITAQAVGNEASTAEPPVAPAVGAEREAPAPVASSAMAVHRPGAGEAVREWLIATVTDERQVATIAIAYTPERRAEALSEGERLLAEAEAAGVAARLVASPDTKEETVISVDFLRNAEDGTSLAQ